MAEHIHLPHVCGIDVTMYTVHSLCTVYSVHGHRRGTKEDRNEKKIARHDQIAEKLRH